MNEFLFGVYPYICLVMLPLGLLFRYIATPGEWNARSSNLFAKKSLVVGSYLFHYAIILAFFGHVIGLLIPTWALTAVGFSPKVHAAVATFFGCIFAPCVFFGGLILLWRRFAIPAVWASTVPMDIVVLLLIMLQAITGGWQDYDSTFDVFDTVAPWIRSILCGQPDPSLMTGVPIYLQLHAISGLTIMALIPFSRLVHFFSIPLTWFFYPVLSYRKRYENL